MGRQSRVRSWLASRWQAKHPQLIVLIMHKKMYAVIYVDGISFGGSSNEDHAFLLF